MLRQLGAGLAGRRLTGWGGAGGGEDGRGREDGAGGPAVLARAAGRAGGGATKFRFRSRLSGLRVGQSRVGRPLTPV